jgi:hypothetical protein
MSEIKKLQKARMKALDNEEDTSPFDSEITRLRKEIGAEIEAEFQAKRLGMDFSEPQFPLSFVLQRAETNYRNGYKEGQEDLSLITDFKIRQLEADLLNVQCGLEEKENELAEVLEDGQQSKSGITQRDCRICGQDTYEQQQNYERIKETLFKENEELTKELSESKKIRIETLNKEIAILKERNQILVNELKPYRQIESQARASKVGMQYAGTARR